MNTTEKSTNMVADGTISKNIAYATKSSNFSFSFDYPEKYFDPSETCDEIDTTQEDKYYGYICSDIRLSYINGIKNGDQDIILGELTKDKTLSLETFIQVILLSDSDKNKIEKTKLENKYGLETIAIILKSDTGFQFGSVGTVLPNGAVIILTSSKNNNKVFYAIYHTESCWSEEKQSEMSRKYYECKKLETTQHEMVVKTLREKE